MPSRITLAAATALLAAAVLALSGSASASVVGSAAVATERFPTPAEMRSAIPAESPKGPIPPGLAFATPRPPVATARVSAAAPQQPERDKVRPYSAHGRLFFQKHDSEAWYSCSGTVVASRNRNVILTAGHCVYDLDTAKFNRNVAFVPAYRNGESPFGRFAAVYSYTPSGWVNGAGQAYDMGAITVAEPIQDIVGARPIDFEYEPHNGAKLTIFGYPALPSPPYDGETPIVCDSGYVFVNVGSPPSLAARPCDMQQGSSGGGWINPSGYLVSVVSHGYCDSDPTSCGIIFGPRLGEHALKIYRRGGGSEPPQLSLARGPRGRITVRRAAFAFRFSASTPVRLECRMLGPSFRGGRSGFRRCGRTRVYRNLRPGLYRFWVRLIDQTGRRSLVQRNFRVVDPRS